MSYTTIGRPRKYRLDEHYFDKIDHQDKAYFLGFLYADGNHMRTSKKRIVRLELHERDRVILVKLSDLLQPDKPIYNYKNGMCCLEIANKHISDKMMDYGLIPNKTFQLKFPDWLPDDLINHFVRGYFDGDGCFILRKSGRMKSYSGYIAIVSTESFCNSLATIFKKDLQINSYIRARHPERMTNTRSLEFGGNKQVKRFLDWIYNNVKLKLDRKYEKYVRFYYHG